MAMRTLMSILTACYGENQNINHIFVKTLKENLGSDISVTQAETLANRLVASHRFSPSIAEIVAEWNQMRKEMNRRVYEAAPVSATMNPETKRLLHEAKDRLREGRTADFRPVSPDIMEFVRQFFPEISEKTVQRNSLEIRNCMSTRDAEIAAGSPYRTYMELNDKGIITLFMRKIA